MSNKIRLTSGRVPTTNASNVKSDRYQFLDISSAEPNLGTAPANNYILVYNTTTPGNRLWVNVSTILASDNVSANIIPSIANTYILGNANNFFRAVYANNYYGIIDGGTFT